VRARGSLLRGERLGGGTSFEMDRGGAVEPRQRVSYWCSANHESRPRLASSAVVPDVWACDRCGQPASRSVDTPPPPASIRGGSPKSPLEFLLMRRSLEDGELLLEEALAKLRASRVSGRR
jgi:hypothetical protein